MPGRAAGVVASSSSLCLTQPGRRSGCRLASMHCAVQKAEAGRHAKGQTDSKAATGLAQGQRGAWAQAVISPFGVVRVGTRWERVPQLQPLQGCLMSDEPC